MKRQALITFAFCASIFISDPAWGQTTTNPDISFIADTRLTDHWNAADTIAPNKAQFNLEELELAAAQYLNPYARADAILSIAGNGELEIEEAYATLLRGLPLNLQIKAGKYFVDFGKINTQHPHQWSWIERPLVNSRFVGEDGLKGIGVDVTTLIPVGSSALNISANLLQGGFLLPSTQQDVAPPLAGIGRISIFAPLGEHSETEIGLSGLTAENDYVNKHRAAMGNFDFKYKWKPDKYHSLVIVAEALANSRKINPDTLNPAIVNKVNSYGTFAAVDYQFKRRFDGGVLLEYAQSPDDKNDHRTGFGVFGGFALAEETYRVGLLLRQDQGTGIGQAYQTVIVQLLWSLGPHKPHQF